MGRLYVVPSAVFGASLNHMCGSGSVVSKDVKQGEEDSAYNCNL